MQVGMGKKTYTVTGSNIQCGEQSPCAGTNTLTVCGAEVSGTPLGLSPVWETHTDLLKHTCTGSDREREREKKTKIH